MYVCIRYFGDCGKDDPRGGCIRFVELVAWVGACFHIAWQEGGLRCMMETKVEGISLDKKERMDCRRGDKLL